MGTILGKLNDGGILIVYPILILLIIIIVLFVTGLKNREKFEKTKSLIASIGWFVIAWGYLGRTIGLIEAFDKIAAAGDVSPAIISNGLRMALVGPAVALFTFIIARLEIIIMILLQKKESK